MAEKDRRRDSHRSEIQPVEYVKIRSQKYPGDMNEKEVQIY
jgi:hypothetical protein